ncbi:hypothetical protein [Flavobacterium crassostreae]|uniref:hypothetical protein n=1 Tax=Flavobacterium crassostreae TaxID=1763534 RepID=UPI0008A4028E|nr:hypothetical protein [Flavobacterium crassostreae]
MKKILYTLAIVATTTLVSCDPLEDITNEVKTETNFEGKAELTMSEDNYKKDLQLKNPYFSNFDQAKALIPTLLNKTYPGAGEAEALVTFKIDAPKTTPSAPVYKIADAEYNPITGNNYKNFDKPEQLISYLNTKYPAAANGDFVSLNYKYYSGSVSVVTDGFLYNGTSWTKIPGFTLDQYKAMGEGYANFSSKTEAEQKLPIGLLDLYKFDSKKTGDVVQSMYELYDSSTKSTTSYVANFEFNGTAFVKYQNFVTQTLSFTRKKNATTWTLNSAVSYTLATQDYASIEASLATKYPNPAANAGKYKNFERRNGSQNFWTNDMIAEGLTFVINKMAPLAQEGEKYNVTFAIYNGAAGTESLTVVKKGNNWIVL